MAKLKHTLDRRTLLTIYTSFVRPSLEYACIIWQSCNQTESDKIENIQTRAAKIITGGISRTNTNLLYEEIGLEKLETRRNRQLLLFLHKLINNNNLPSYLQDLKPNDNFNRHNRNLRSRHNIDQPKHRIKRYEDSLIPKAITLWNTLPTEAKNMPIFNDFKLYLEKDVPKPKELFFLGNRKMNIALSRIRLKCSNLKAHLFELKIINDPSCSCGYFYEDSIHFFFICPLYIQQRTDLHNKINPLLPLYTAHPSQWI